jgi:hypothetical protein
MFNDKVLSYKITFPEIDEFSFINDTEGDRIKMHGFGNSGVPGTPMLPTKNLLFALPPGTEPISVNFKVNDVEKVPGFYDITPVPHIVFLDDSNADENLRLQEEWLENYQTFYSSDQKYPKNPGKLTGFGTFRKYSYASVSVCPFIYYPVSKQLYYIDSVEIEINYEIENSIIFENMFNDDIFDEKASKLFFNYNEIHELYKPDGNIPKPLKNSYDYVIITTEELKPIVESSNFYHWKTTLGYSTKFVTVTDSLITSQPGIDLAEQIRNFLRENYLPWGIKYVLIVGDYTDVPMRYCSPNPDWLAGTVPTDTYYADLSYPDSESWNSNGDEYYGVYTQDNPDFAPEVYVGRIPTSDVSRLVYTLDKITSVEQDTGSWKNNALHGGAMLFYANEDHNEDIDFDIDGARMIDYIEKDLMDGFTYNHYSEYEGLSPSIYPFDPLTEQAFTADWRSGQYAIVNWAAHGAPASIGRVIWEWDDGDGVPEKENGELGWGSFLSTYSNLEGDYPAIVFAVSCNVGRPEPTPDGNLGIDMLTKESFGAAVAVCSSTRGAAVSADWVVSHAGAEALCYEFNHYMIDGPNGPSKLGEALYDSKSYVHYNFGWEHPYEFMNMYDYNLYGDPSMWREGVSGSAPSAPQINGPASGKTGEKYDYTFRSIDPTDDDVFYYIEWDDGDILEWVGPYNSREEITFSHTWISQNTFNIRAKAKDDSGEESLWTSLEVSMSKPKSLDLSRFFEIFRYFSEKISIFSDFYKSCTIKLI